MLCSISIVADNNDDDAYSSSVNYNGSLPNNRKYLYVCDENDNLMLVFDASKTLYLNIRRYL